MSEDKVFVGFGFGAIQSGVFLLEAFRSKKFKELIVAEVIPEVVDAVRNVKGNITINIAHADFIEKAVVKGIDIRDPNKGEDQEFLIGAVARANEISTAVPSVRAYISNNPGSIHVIIARGLAEKKKLRGPACVIYTAENHNRAAVILEESVKKYADFHDLDIDFSSVQFLNTVIGKMSQVITDEEEINNRKIMPIIPQINRSFLVEAFNSIYISKIRLLKFDRGIDVFEEKINLLPFEEAKLFGHNAIHSVLGFLGAQRNIKSMDELIQHKDILKFGERAFKEEIGSALIKKYHGQDELFTRYGFDNYVEDLLNRMVNPMLRDAISRVTRDVERKLGWEDRIIGSLRCCIENEIMPTRLAFGALAAEASVCRNINDELLQKIIKRKDVWINEGKSINLVNSITNTLVEITSAFQAWKKDIKTDPEKWIL